MGLFHKRIKDSSPVEIEEDYEGEVRTICETIDNANLQIKIIRKENEKIDFDYYENALFKQLNSLRKEISKKENIAPYIIFSDMTLIEMAEKKPTNRWEMLKIKGIGNQKFTSYGERFLERINTYNMEEKK